MRKIIPVLFAMALALALEGCVSSRMEGGPLVSRTLADKGVKSAAELADFFVSENPDCDKDEILELAKIYVEESAAEGINSDCAWVQMCHETGFLRFGNLVKPEMHNYCGLGAIDAENPGLWFETPRMGVRAHIQHLHAYATTEDKVLSGELVDPRYKYVRPRGKAATIEGLAGTWAADREYSVKLESLLVRLEKK